MSQGWVCRRWRFPFWTDLEGPRSLFFTKWLQGCCTALLPTQHWAVLSSGGEWGGMLSHLQPCWLQSPNTTSEGFWNCAIDPYRKKRVKVSVVPFFALSIYVKFFYVQEMQWITKAARVFDNHGIIKVWKTSLSSSIYSSIMCAYQYLNFDFDPPVLLFTYYCIPMSNWMTKRCYVRTMDAPLALTDNVSRLDKFRIFSTEADKNIH